MRIKCLCVLWCALSAVTFAVDTPNAITYQDTSGNQWIYVFAQGSNGDLVVNYRDPAGWHWADQGLPPGAAWVGQISAISYSDGINRLIYVFAQTDQGHLVVNYWTGHHWYWADQGLPAGVTALGIVNGGTNQNLTSAVTYQDASQVQRLDVFAVTNTGRLVRNYWDGSSWQWADQELPQGSSGVYSVSAITYVDKANNNRIYVFAETDEGRVAVNYFDGSSWGWADQGIPASFNIVIRPTAVTFSDAAGNQRIYVFALGVRLGKSEVVHLVVNYWNGFHWSWADQGLAPNMTFVPPAVISYGAGASLRIDAFVVAGHTVVNDSIYDNYWDGSRWHWKNLGHPPTITQFQNESPTAITFPANGLQQTYVFAVDQHDTDLFMDYRDAFGWSWNNQGPK